MPLYVCVSVSLCLSLFMSTSLCVSLDLNVSPCLSLSLRMSLSLSVLRLSLSLMSTFLSPLSPQIIGICTGLAKLFVLDELI